LVAGFALLWILLGVWVYEVIVEFPKEQSTNGGIVGRVEGHPAVLGRANAS
jgi:hypothetical protein